MSASSARFGILRRGVWLALLLLLPAAGCIKNWMAHLRGTGFDEGSRRLTAEIPERAPEGKPFSFSTKAQEIEGNFGYR